MHDKEVNARNPGCIVFLLDRSESMGKPWGNTGQNLAEETTSALNALLMELCLRSSMGPGEVRHYFDVGIFGYGLRPVAGGEGVESAFGGLLADQPLVSVPDIRNNPRGLRERPSADEGAPPVKAPVWIEPSHGHGTPLCQAIAVAGGHIAEWTAGHPGSFPPVVINVTASTVTDSPFDGATLDEWAQRLVSIETADGPVLLFNMFLSPTGGGALFPAAGSGLPAPGPDLFRASSLLPETMVAHLRSSGMAVEDGARGFGFNADLSILIRCLKIST